MHYGTCNNGSGVDCGDSDNEEWLGGIMNALDEFAKLLKKMTRELNRKILREHRQGTVH